MLQAEFSSLFDAGVEVRGFAAAHRIVRAAAHRIVIPASALYDVRFGLYYCC